MFEPIAIVGRGCVLPGAFSAGQLWDLVAAGRSLIEDAPAGAWPDEPQRFLAADQTTAHDDLAAGCRGGFVRGFEASFDPGGFHVPQDEVQALDRTRQWLLDAGRQAVREAGRDDLRGTPAAVVVGNLSYPTATLCELAHEVLIEPLLAPLARRVHNQDARHPWTDRFCSGRPAHLLAAGLGAAGPAFALDAACASSLYAVKLACDYLQDRTVDIALAGAVNGVDNIFLHLGFSRIKALSPSGMSRPFSRLADGLLPAEGAAALCLKRLADAIAAGDRVHGIIRGIGLANDGRQRGLLVPDPKGQARAIQRAYEVGGIDPATISLMECHATGTPTGDRIEIASLKTVFGGSGDLPVGSLKSNLGHLITVAGLAAVIKVTGALAAATRPPTLNAEQPLCDFEGSAIRPLHAGEAWPAAAPRRAGISNFGFGGNNAHLIVEEYSRDTSSHAIRLPAAAAVPEIALCGIRAIIGPHRGLGAIGEALRHNAPASRAEQVELPLGGLRFPPADLRETLAQHTLLLEAALAAAAAVSPATPERAGVFVGMGCDPDSARPGLRWRIRPALKRLGIALDEPAIAELERGIGGLQGPNYVIGAMPNLPANRINLQLDWRGIGLTVSSEELSGLTALELAVRALRAGELDVAMAGAVDLCHGALHRKAIEQVLPASLHRPADAAIAFVLKRRADAERDGDPILAIVEPAPSARNGAAPPIAAPGHSLGHAHAAAGLVDLLCALLQDAPGANQTVAVERVSYSGQWQSATARRVAWPIAGDSIVASAAEKAPRNMLTLPAHLAPIAMPVPAAAAAGSAPPLRSDGARPSPFAAGRPAEAMPAEAPTGPAFGRRELEVLAGGTISEVFGPLFQQQDGFRRQCRMPQPPLLLADRVVGIAGTPGSMDKGICWTETDIAPDAWYLHNGRMPTGLLIESGQADLLLISWLGVDFLNRGERIYRLLGCEITFHDAAMPEAGETLRFQIHIDAHAKLGDQRLFFFRYDARVGDRLISSVRQGQAGFFSDAELANAGGVLWSAEQDRPKPDARLDPPPRCTTKRSFSAAEVAAFAAGDAYACFGAGFELAAAHQRTPGLPSGRMRLIDRVPEFDPTGGPWGRGYLRAETDVPVDAWFYDGHFLNDPCMPGTLMAEAAVQALQFHMTALGFTIGRDGWVFRPVPGEAFKFVCRGQVVPDRPHRVTYEVFIEEVNGGDQPEIYGALLARSDDFKVFLCRRFGIRLVQDWPLYGQAVYRDTADEKRIVSPVGDVRGDYRALLACAWGRPSEAFGSMYAAFDSPVSVPRLPGLPYHFMSRVVSVDCPPGRPTDGGGLVVEYDPKPDDWYFAASGSRTMPFAVLVEVLLQGCGWLASYMGFALPGGLKFRNLDGENAIVHAPVTPETGALRCEVTFVKRATAGPMTIVFYEVVCRAAGGDHDAQDRLRILPRRGAGEPEGIVGDAGAARPAAGAVRRQPRRAARPAAPAGRQRDAARRPRDGRRGRWLLAAGRQGRARPGHRTPGGQARQLVLQGAFLRGPGAARLARPRGAADPAQGPGDAAGPAPGHRQPGVRDTLARPADPLEVPRPGGADQPAGHHRGRASRGGPRRRLDPGHRRGQPVGRGAADLRSAEHDPADSAGRRGSGRRRHDDPDHRSRAGTLAARSLPDLRHPRSADDGGGGRADGAARRRPARHPAGAPGECRGQFLAASRRGRGRAQAAGPAAAGRAGVHPDRPRAASGLRRTRDPQLPDRAAARAGALADAGGSRAGRRSLWRGRAVSCRRLPGGHPADAVGHPIMVRARLRCLARAGRRRHHDPARRRPARRPARPAASLVRRAGGRCLGLSLSPRAARSLSSAAGHRARADRLPRPRHADLAHHPGRRPGPAGGRRDPRARAHRGADADAGIRLHPDGRPAALRGRAPVRRRLERGRAERRTEHPRPRDDQAAQLAAGHAGGDLRRVGKPARDGRGGRDHGPRRRQAPRAPVASARRPRGDHGRRPPGDRPRRDRAGLDRRDEVRGRRSLTGHAGCASAAA
jgi:3-oxoacyl-(acyl-carrier-protein) synthase/3-hydroxymyristoyl/3-hydroxydecanoyl-(acyl carrier protein) dehydratase